MIHESFFMFTILYELSLDFTGLLLAFPVYLHNDPDEVVTKSGPMSLNVDNYEPACVSCHRLFDYKVLTSKA